MNNTLVWKIEVRPSEGTIAKENYIFDEMKSQQQNWKVKHISLHLTTNILQYSFQFQF